MKLLSDSAARGTTRCSASSAATSSKGIAGGFGLDRILGGAGDDTIGSIGGSCDIVDCGPGRDRIEKGSRDVTRNCEIVL